MKTLVPLMIDSGAYTAWAQNKPVLSVEEYVEWLKPIVEEYPDIEYINLDVIGDETGEQSYRNWIQIREAGLNPIPVFHIASPFKWLKRYLAQTDHIALSGSTTDNQKENQMWLENLWLNYFCDSNRIPKVKVHGLGLTGFPVIKRYPWYSVDSTAALHASSNGKIWVAKFAGGKWDFSSTSPTNIFVSSQGKEEGHYYTLTKSEQEIVKNYIKHMGFEWGKSKWGIVKGEEKEIIVEPGVSNSHIIRGHINIQFMSEFIRTFPYPRPFSSIAKKGIFG